MKQKNITIMEVSHGESGSNASHASWCSNKDIDQKPNLLKHVRKHDSCCLEVTKNNKKNCTSLLDVMDTRPPRKERSKSVNRWSTEQMEMPQQVNNFITI